MGPVAGQTPGVIANASVREFFQESVASAMDRQRLKASDDTVYYVVELLTSFTRSDELFDRTPDGPTLKPLALFYADALSAPSNEMRNQTLKRLGDVALFISGVFSSSLQRKLVDVDYYIAMGGNAYGYLSDNARGTMRAKVFQDIFAELSTKFQHFVDVLAEISEQSQLDRETSVLRLYELWLRTGSERAAEKLRAIGIHPNAAATSHLQH